MNELEEELKDLEDLKAIAATEPDRIAGATGPKCPKGVTEHCKPKGVIRATGVYS